MAPLHGLVLRGPDMEACRAAAMDWEHSLRPPFHLVVPVFVLSTRATQAFCDSRDDRDGGDRYSLQHRGRRPAYLCDRRWRLQHQSSTCACPYLTRGRHPRFLRLPRALAHRFLVVHAAADHPDAMKKDRTAYLDSMGAPNQHAPKTILAQMFWQGIRSHGSESEVDRKSTRLNS